MVRADRRSWVPAAFWASTAVVSVTLATVFAAQPERLRDLHEVRSWLSFVQTQDGDPYRHFAGKLDYPPIALLVLLPLSLIPDATLVHWFVPLNLTVTVFAGWVLARAIAERLNTPIALQAGSARRDAAVVERRADLYLARTDGIAVNSGRSARAAVVPASAVCRRGGAGDLFVQAPYGPRLRPRHSGDRRDQGPAAGGRRGRSTGYRPVG